MSNKNFHIAKFYAKLFELKDLINNDLLPIGTHIAISTNDAKLFESLEVLATDIDEHLTRFELCAKNKPHGIIENPDRTKRPQMS